MKKKAKSKAAFSWAYMAVCVSVVLCGIGLHVYLTETIPRKATVNPPTSSIEVEDVILRKLTSKKVDPRFTPVIIYRLNPTNQNKASMAGSGVFFEGSNGKQIVTSEHLFLKEYSTQSFAFRKLQPLEDAVTHGIEGIVNFSNEMETNGTRPDVVILKAGNLKPIECFADRANEDKDFPARPQITPVLNKVFVTSLVSGEKMRIVGITTSIRDGVKYHLIDNLSIQGESGSGFIDANGDLFVLKGSPIIDPNEEQRVRKKLGYSKGLSFLYGPLRLR